MDVKPRMRMRKKPNLLPRLQKAAALMIENPELLRGKWRESFGQYGALQLELGCGKGRFTVQTAKNNAGDMLVAVERVLDAMVIAMERAMEQEISNVRFIDRDVIGLDKIFAPGEVDIIYINFCDPWPKSRDAKHRLTSPQFLRLYADALSCGGKICFKTDNLPLFQWSLGQLEAEGWELGEVTTDLHGGGAVGVMTDYEARFYEQGIKINRLAAKKTESTKSTKDGGVPRLCNASLVDARGYEDSKMANA